MSIGKDVRKLADKKFQRYVTTAQKQGVDLDKLSEQEIKYMLELNKTKAPKVLSNEDAVAFLNQFLKQNEKGKVIKADFGKPFAEEVVTVDSVITDIKKLEKDGKIEIYTQYQLSSAKGNTSLESIEIKHEEGEIKSLKANYLLGFFGLIMQLGPILNWGLNLDKKKIPVNTENFETNLKGIFAIGDICMYPGKLKLILSGFHEGALAARGCFKYARPDEKLRFEFTTTSKSVHSRLKVKK